MRWRLGALCVLILNQVILAQEMRLRTQQQGAGVLSRTVIVPPDRFTLRWARRAASRFIETNRSKFRVMQLYMFVSEHDIHSAMGFGGSGLVDPRQWKEACDRIAGRPLPMAEAIAVGESAVLRFRGRDDRIDRVVLFGSDPLLLEYRGARFETLKLRFWKVPQLRRDQKVEPLGAIFHVRTAAPLTEELCREVTGILARRIGLQNVLTSYRNDAWFIEDPDFPAVYPFEPRGVPPTVEEWDRTVTGHCYVDPSRTACGCKRPTDLGPRRPRQ